MAYDKKDALAALRSALRKKRAESVYGKRQGKPKTRDTDAQIGSAKGKEDKPKLEVTIGKAKIEKPKQRFTSVEVGDAEPGLEVEIGDATVEKPKRGLSLAARRLQALKKKMKGK